MDKPLRAILLIADISGYTPFVKEHAVAAHHAALITTRLLQALTRDTRPPLQLIEVEGDALFFCATSFTDDLSTLVAPVKHHMLQCFRRFEQELDRLQSMKGCPCAACRRVSELQLKLVVHVGDVALGRVGRFQKPFGLDVIVVHRLLKNSARPEDCVLMTDAAYEILGDFNGLAPEQRREHLEGLGAISAFIFYVSPLLAQGMGSKLHQEKPSWHVKIDWWFKLHPQTLAVFAWTHIINIAMRFQ